MTAVHRMRILEQQAGTILLKLGYKPVIVSNCFRNPRYILFNLSARKELEDGTIDAVMVKLKISLHAMQSLDEAAVFCRNEIGRLKRFFDQVPQGVKCSRFEVWISIPSDRFQQFEITRDGIREILIPDEKTGQNGGKA